MAAQKNVAIITGGASGMGLAVAEALTKRGNWDLHLFDMNEKSGDEAARNLGATFHRVNVTDYTSLSEAFKKVFLVNRRLDFVYANAGIMERADFYQTHDTGDEPPPPLNTIVLDINTNAVVQTSYLAQHYFRQTPNDGTAPRSLIITASCGGLYACPASPIYGASKFAALGWTRNIAGLMWKNDGELRPGTFESPLIPLICGVCRHTSQCKHHLPVSYVLRRLNFLLHRPSAQVLSARICYRPTPGRSSHRITSPPF